MERHHPQESRRDATKPFAIFSLIMLLVMIFPVYGLGNSFEPQILGLPFSLFWIVAWIAVEFVGLVCFLAYEFGGRD